MTIITDENQTFTSKLKEKSKKNIERSSTYTYQTDVQNNKANKGFSNTGQNQSAEKTPNEGNRRSKSQSSSSDDLEVDQYYYLQNRSKTANRGISPSLKKIKEDSEEYDQQSDREAKAVAASDYEVNGSATRHPRLINISIDNQQPQQPKPYVPPLTNITIARQNSIDITLQRSADVVEKIELFLSKRDFKQDKSSKIIPTDLNIDHKLQRRTEQSNFSILTNTPKSLSIKSAEITFGSLDRSGINKLLNNTSTGSSQLILPISIVHDTRQKSPSA